MPIRPNDFATLALALRSVLANHKVPPDVRASLIEDIVFQFAVFIDEKTGTDFHESVLGVLGEHAKQLSASPKPSDHLVMELQVVFLKGRRAELNILRSCLLKPSVLRLNLEVALGVRDITEVGARVDTHQRFADLMKKKAGIKALMFSSASNIKRPSWQEVRLQGSAYGTFEQSLDGLVACIRNVAAEWQQGAARK